MDGQVGEETEGETYHFLDMWIMTKNYSECDFANQPHGSPSTHQNFKKN